MARRPDIWTLRDWRRLVGSATQHPNGMIKMRRAPGDGDIFARGIAVITDGGDAVRIDGVIDERMPWITPDAGRVLDRMIARYGAHAPVALIVDGGATLHGAEMEDGVLVIGEQQIADSEDTDADADLSNSEAGDGEGDAATPMDGGDNDPADEQGGGESAEAADGAGDPADGGEPSGSGPEDHESAGATAGEAGEDGESRAHGSSAAGEEEAAARSSARQADKGEMGAPAGSDSEPSGDASPRHDDGEPGDQLEQTARGAAEAEAHADDANDAASDPKNPEAGDGESPGSRSPDTATGEKDGDTNNKEADGEEPSETQADDRAGHPASDAAKADAERVRDEVDGNPTDGGGDSPYGGPAMTEIAAAVMRARQASRAASRAIEHLLRQVIAPSGRRVPLVDERRLITELVTRRYAISRARREQGRPRRIIITPDGSGSCHRMIEATLPAVQAIRHDLGADVIGIVPNANGCPWRDDEVLADAPEWLRRLLDMAETMLSTYPYDSHPVAFWRAMLDSGDIAAIIYIGDGDADLVWRKVDDRRVISIRERYGSDDIGATQTIDIRAQDDGEPAAYLLEIARQLRTARIQPV